jgi:hypothetical protein
MSDLLDTNDPMRSAFGQFRAEASGEVTAAGPSAVRRTVRNRRAARVAATAALAIAAFAGGSLAYAGATGRGATPAGPPNGSPSVPSFPGASQSLAEKLVGDNAPAFMAGSGAFPHRRMDYDDTDYAAGTYELMGVCLGTGRSVMTIKYDVSPGGPAWDTTKNVKSAYLDCAAGSVVRLRVDMLAGHGMTVQVNPDPDAANDHTYYAYHVVRL